MARQTAELAHVLELAQSAESRFTTLQATVRDWSWYRRIVEIQGSRWDAASAPDAEARELRIWVDEDRRVREEWDTGFVRHGTSIDCLTNWPLLDPTWMTADAALIAIGARNAAGRIGYAIEVGESPAEMLLPGADRCICVVDRERGVLLRCEAWLGTELLMVEELFSVVFDAPLDENLFAEAE